MPLSPKKKYTVISLIAMAIMAGVFFVAVMLAPEAPTKHLDQAMRSLAEARKSRADIFAPVLFNKSQLAYNTAMDLWKVENDKFILNRNFKVIDSCTSQSIALSKLATKQSLLNSKNIEVAALASIQELENTVVKFEKIMSDLPLDAQNRQNFEKGRMLLSEARYKYNQKDFTGSKVKLDSAENHIHKAVSSVKKLLSSYFQSYPDWKKWYEETLASSRNKRHNAIVVDKIAKQCYVYKNGKLAHSFDIELGKNWIGDKRFQGDKTTPEGIYKVTKKLDAKMTKYYKALLINYPNEVDKKRFSSEMKNGTLPRNASIGGLVEIHGEGGKGVNWTDGCIALHNNDMDVVYNLADVNIPIVIVGSLVGLEEIIDF